MLLLVVFLLLSATNFFWLSYDTIPPDWDWAGHMISALKYHQAMSDYLQQPDWFSFKAVKALRWTLLSVDQSVYPPLYMFIGGLSIFVVGTSIKWLSMTNMFFMAGVLYGLYQIGKKVHGEETGALACILVCLYPTVADLSHQYMLEIALLAISALSVYFLLYSDMFRDRLFTALFGVSVGVGLLIKPTYLSFIAGPVCFVAVLIGYDVFKGSLRPREVAWRSVRLLSSLTVGLALAALWYGPNWGIFTREFLRTVSLDTAGIRPFSIDSFLYVPRMLITYQIGLPFFILLLFGLTRMRHFVEQRNAWFLWTWALGIYLIQVSVKLKTGRQHLAILLPFAIISAIGLSTMTRWKKSVVALVLLFGFLQFATLSLPEHWLANKVGGFKWAGHFSMFPKKEDWKIEQALSSIGGKKATVAVMSDHSFINPVTIRYYAVVLGLPLVTVACQDIVKGRRKLSSSDFVVAKSDTDWIPNTGGQGDYCFFGSGEDYREILKKLDDKTGSFDLFRKFPLPDGTELLVYKRV